MAKSGELFKFACKCGAKLTAPVKMAGRKGKCNVCELVQIIPEPDKKAIAAAAGEKSASIQEICSICQTGIEDDDERVTCNKCELPFHSECWTENLGCSAYGCENVDALKQGPDIRIDPNPYMPALQPPPGVARNPPQVEDDDLPIDHLLLGASAIAAMIGFFTCGIPTIIIGALSIWRLFVNVGDNKPIYLPILSAIFCALAFLFGLCLSAMYWVS